MPSIDIHIGDCRDVLEKLPENSVDSLVTDPPAGISFMTQAWDSDKGGRDGWINWMAEVMTLAHKALKPGGFALVWAIPRTSHWTATALELAGFEIRDVITHHFGSGFPKSMDIAKAIDKMLGVEPEVVRMEAQGGPKFKMTQEWVDNGGFNDASRTEYAITRAASELAKQWEGWGTALKPGSEHWILCRKAPAGTVAKNIARYAVGGLNVDDCRIDTADDCRRAVGGWQSGGYVGGTVTNNFNQVENREQAGRWPANLILTHSDDCGLYCADDCPARAMGDEARFFKVFDFRFIYCPKPTMAKKNTGLDDFENRICKDGRKTEIDNAFQRGETQRKNFHPTVKSIALMDYLIRLITPSGGTVLDPFMGSGTTGVAALLGGWEFLGIEKEPNFYEIASARIEQVGAGQQSLFSTEGAI